MKLKASAIVLGVVATCSCSLPVLAGDFTHETATLSEARRSVAAVGVGDLALFAGGDANGSRTDTVDIYNAVSREWTTATLSVARNAISVGSVGDTAIFAGGVRYNPAIDPDMSTYFSDAVDLYDSASGTWTTATLSRARVWMATVTVGDLVLLGGGSYWDPHVVASDIVDVYDASNGTWSTMSLPSAAGDDLTGLSVGGLALFADDDTVDVYDPAAGEWTTTAVPGNRLGIGQTAGDKAVFIGEDGAAVFDAATREWTFTDEPAAGTDGIPESGKLQSSTSVGETIVFGGIRRCVTYNTATGEWGNPCSDCSSLAYAGAATSLDGKALFDSGWVWEPQDPAPSTKLDIVRAAWGSSGPDGDLNGDGFVGSADLDIVRADWSSWPWTQGPKLSIFDPETGGWSYATGTVGEDRTAVLSVGDTALFVSEDGAVDLYIATGPVGVPEPSTFVGLLSLLAALCGRRRR